MVLWGVAVSLIYIFFRLWEHQTGSRPLNIDVLQRMPSDCGAVTLTPCYGFLTAGLGSHLVGLPYLGAASVMLSLDRVCVIREQHRLLLDFFFYQ